jgi:sensor histidine kinase YesM
MWLFFRQMTQNIKRRKFCMNHRKNKSCNHFICNLLNLKNMKPVNNTEHGRLPSAKWIQVGVWVLFLLFLSLYTIQKWDAVWFGIYNALIAITSYIIAVYGHASFLLPRYYKPGNKRLYFFYTIIFLTALIAVRMFTEYKLLFPLHKNFYNFSTPHFAFDFITVLVAFLFGALLHVSINYISLLQKQETMKRQQTAAELELLKAQVQPHFLFNTLNNIYYLAYIKSDKTAEVVAKLSEIMRYFVDEATKEKIPLQTELKFISNYIELEKIRMLHPIEIEKDIQVNDHASIPPMLLISLIENIFKHGIDKMKKNNCVHISLKQAEDYLVLKTVNMVEANQNKPGNGLTNLRKRLTLLYGDDFVLYTKNNNGQFIAELKFPLK